MKIKDQGEDAKSHALKGEKKSPGLSKQFLEAES